MSFVPFLCFQVDKLQQSPAPRVSSNRGADSRDWNNEPYQHRVQGYQTQIAGPAMSFANGQLTTRAQYFPERHEQEDAQKRSQSYGDFELV